MCGRDEVIRDANAADSGSGEPYTRSQPRIWDRCPSCGARTLFVGAGGWLTCSVIGCKEPGNEVAVEALRARCNELTRELARRDNAIQMVDGVVRPVPWDGSRAKEVGHEALLLALDRLRAAAEAVARGVQSDVTVWWPNRAAEMAVLEVRCNEAANLISLIASLSVASPKPEAPHA